MKPPYIPGRDHFDIRVMPFMSFMLMFKKCLDNALRYMV